MADIHQLKVGIELGKFYSAVAWIILHRGTPKEFNVITQWPGSRLSSQKVPSTISYTPTEEVYNWGFGVKCDEERTVPLGPLLKTSEPTTQSHYSNTTQEEFWIPNSKTQVDIITDYLSSLRKHAIDSLTRALGKSFMEAVPIDYVLIVPAGLSKGRKEMILQAAKCTGLGDDKAIGVISDIEAAAAWILHENGPDDLKLHDAFVIVDCGSDTTNYQSYEVMGHSPPTLEECCMGSQELFGSNLINQGFEDLLKLRIGERFGKLKWIIRNTIFKQFSEGIKRSFTGSEDIDYIQLPGIPDDSLAGIEDGFLALTNEDMKGIFDPLIDQIIPLIQKQINIIKSQGKRKLNAVVLVGEFGSSHYLLQRLIKDLKEIRDSPVFEVIQPQNTLNASVRGSLLGAQIIRRRPQTVSQSSQIASQSTQVVSQSTQVVSQSTQTTSQRAKRYYGAETETEFLFGKHPLENLSYCQYTGEKLCCHRMVWYIKEGDQLPENHTVYIPFRKRVGLDDAMIFTDVIFSWETLSPEYSNRPSNINSSVVKRLCKVTSDLSTIPKSSFTKKTGPAWAPHYEVEYNLVLKIRPDDTPGFELAFQEKTYCVAVEYLDD